MGPLKVGTTLSEKYRIERLLSESGGVILYEATDVPRSERVWIKILQRESLGQSDALARFQREARGPKVLDVGKSEDGLPFVVAKEFGPALPKVAPRPVPPRGSPKSTLRGVAPPPPPLPKPATPSEEDETAPPSSSIPLLADDVELLPASVPPPPLASLADDNEPPATFAKAAKTLDEPAPVVVEPQVSAPAPAAPKPPEPPEPPERPERPEPIEAVDVLVTPLPLPPKRPPTPTIPSLREIARREAAEHRASAPATRPSNARWIAAMLLASGLTGFGGWYVGRHQANLSGGSHAAPTASTTLGAPPPETVTTVASQAPTAEQEPATVASAEPSSAPLLASASPADTEEKPKAKPPTPTTPPPIKPVRKPPKKPTPSGDPLTL